MASQQLTEDALANEPAVTPSVEENAPGTVGEVDGGSAQETQDVVPAARFNGLMGRLNQEIAARKKLEEQLELLQTQIKEPPQVSDTRSEELYTLLMEEKIENARAKILQEYPQLGPIADFIVGETPQDVLEVGRKLGERLKASQAGAQTEPTETKVEETAREQTTETTETVEEAPVVGGGVTFNGEATVDDRITDAIKKKDFSSYLQAKFEKAVASGDVEGLSA